MNRWRIVYRVTGKLRLTRHRMTEADAMRRHPGAIKDETSLEWRDIAETPEEIAERDTSPHSKFARK